MRWQDLTDFYTGVGPEARSRHSTSAVNAPSGVQLLTFGGASDGGVVPMLIYVFVDSFIR